MSQEAEPVFAWYVPEMQLLHESEADDAAKVPTAQAEQVVEPVND
jgi:hypothetical protein